MAFFSGHKGFDEAVNRGYIGRGNVWADTQFSGFIRAHEVTECNGRQQRKGLLRNYDLEPFKRYIPHDLLREVIRHTQSDDAILYRFFHWHGRRRIEHGWLMTDTDHHKLARCDTGPTWKSRAVMDAAEAVICAAMEMEGE